MAVCFFMFSWLPKFLIVFKFCYFGLHLGLHLACFAECLGTFKIELERWREYDFHTQDLLFSGPISSPEFAADFFMIVSIFCYFGPPFGSRLLSPFGWKMEVRKEAGKKVRQKVTRGVTRESPLDLLAPKEEALRSPSSSESCRIWHWIKYALCALEPRWRICGCPINWVKAL